MVRSKLIPLFALLSAGAFAQNGNPPPQPLLRRHAHPPTPAPCGIEEGRNCCFARGCPGGYGVALEIDFLWWRAENHGFSYAFESKNPLAAVGPLVDTIGSIQRVSPKWDPGVRVGLGWNTNYDRWDLFADWTWYANHSRKTRQVSSTNPSVVGYYPLFPIATTNTPYARVHGSYHMWFNSFTLELGRAFYATRHVSLRPHAGVQTGWINQRVKSSFNFPLQTNATSFPEQDFHGKSNCWGVGPRFGLHSTWEIGYGFSMLGRFAGSLLYGRSKNFYLSEYLLSGGTSFTTSNQIHDGFYQLTPTMQLFLGFQWGGCVDKCRGIWFGIDAGWESTVWWNQFNIPMATNAWYAPLPTTSSQPVTLEGATINARLDF